MDGGQSPPTDGAANSTAPGAVLVSRRPPAGRPPGAALPGRGARLRPVAVAIALALAAASCVPAPRMTGPPIPTTPSPAAAEPAALLEARIEELLGRMTLEEKIGQMTLVEKGSITPEEVRARLIGGVLSGGGGYPRGQNPPEGWQRIVRGFQEAALQTRLGIPLLYGVDAVHGHGNVRGATVFPHNVALGASRDPDLVRRVARATAVEVAATGIHWNYAPVLAVPQDLRWGRAYEAFAERPELVTELGRAYLLGLQSVDGEVDLGHPLTVLGTPKHYVGDGGTSWGTSARYQIDQGLTEVDEETLRRVHLRPYRAAIEAGALSVMASFSSWGGLKMHAHRTLLTDVLRGELGFQGFVVSDWGGIDQLSADYDQAVVTAINAGVDMNMVPQDYDRFIRSLTAAVERGQVARARIDQAVGRILRAKLRLGLFERPLADPSLLERVGSAEHRRLARLAVARSLVQLKNADGTLPLSPDVPLVLVGGAHADDIGLQSGGWTIEWQGARGAITEGTTLLEGIRQAVSPRTEVHYDRFGRFERSAPEGLAEVGIAVVGEEPYAEGEGDRADLTLSQPQRRLVRRMRERVRRLVVVLISGRPLIVTGELELADAFVAAWLPGSEGQGVADVLFGQQPFTGRLPYTWPRDMSQVPLGAGAGGAEPLFPYGYP